MDLKRILLRYFLPTIACFFFLSGISLLPAVQHGYYPFFERISLKAGKSTYSELYFKTKKGTEESPNNPDKVSILFNTKVYLQGIIDRSRATGTKGVYDYKGVVISISESFVTPIIFLFSLLLVTPSSIPRKGINFLLGSLLVLGFAYLTVRFRVNFAIVEAGLPGMNFDAQQIKVQQIFAYAFSSVTTITIVLLVWILLAFRKSDLKKVFANGELKMEN